MKKVELCESNYIHEDIVEKIERQLNKSEMYTTLAEMFKVFGDPTRIKILQILSISEVCVCDLAALINISQSAVSHQLRFLRHAKIVKYRKEGKIVFYSLQNNKIKNVINWGLKYLNEK